MKVGRFTIEQLSEGQFEIFEDGSIHRTPAVKEKKSKGFSVTHGQSIKTGINPILVTDENYSLLIETGLGWGLDSRSRYNNISNTVTNLDIFGLRPKLITHIVLSHLHYDHAAGSSFTDSSVSTQPTFPNAKYYVQKREWDYAVSRVGNSKTTREMGVGYRLDDMYRLYADGRLILLEEDLTELIPGIKLIWTGGHTPGHQIIRIEDNNKIMYYLGDLLPSEHHLNHYAMRHLDVNPMQAKKMKLKLLRSVYKENALLLFYHSLFSSAGHLEKGQNKKYILKELL